MLHPVSCKIALYNQDNTAVLLAEYLPNKFGLPGGHMEGNEDIEATIRREVREELGIVLKSKLVRKDFWLHKDGRIILGYESVLDDKLVFSIDEKELLSARWVLLKDIHTHKITTDGYDDFILENKM